MEHNRIPLQAYKYQPPGKRDIGRPRRRWRETTTRILEAGTGDSPNPWGDDDDDLYICCVDRILTSGSSTQQGA
jgi:hypothetical protein